VIYDLTDPGSFNNVQKWLQEIERYACENVCKVLVGNKSDLKSERKVDSSEINEFAEALELKSFETSAKEDHNITEVFFWLTMEVLEKMIEEPIDKRQYWLNLRFGRSSWESGTFVWNCLNIKEDAKNKKVPKNKENMFLRLPPDVRQYVAKIFVGLFRL